MSIDATVTYHRAQAPSLVIISGSHHGHRIPVPASGIVLGRGGELASLFGDDSLVSREHARISLAGDGSAQVEDLGSTNGTFINGIAIAAPSRLGGMDVLRIGAAEMRLTQDNAAGPPGGPSEARSGADLLAEGRALLEQRRYEESRQAFLAAATRPETAAEASYGLGVVALSQDNLPLAESYFGQAIDGEPGHANALYQLGYICEQRHEIAAAGDYYRSALRARPGHVGALLALERLGGASQQTRTESSAGPVFGDPISPPPSAAGYGYGQGVYQLLQTDKTPVSQQAVALMDKVEREVDPPRYIAYVGRYFTRTVAWLVLPVVLLFIVRAIVGFASSRNSTALPSFLSGPEISKDVRSVFILMLCLGLIIFLISLVRVNCTAIRIRQGRLQVEKGVFHKHTINIDFWRMQNIDLDRRLVNRLTGDGTLIITLTFAVLPEEYKRERNWKKPARKVIEICGFAHGGDLEQTYQDLLNLSFLLRGNPIVKGIIQ